MANIKVYSTNYLKKNQGQVETLNHGNCMKDKLLMGIQMDGVDLFIEMEVIILANLIMDLQEKVRSMIKMEIKFMKKFIKFTIEIFYLYLKII